MNTNQAYQACERIITHHSKSFYKAFKTLPPPLDNAVFAIYALCRRADDIADEGGTLAQLDALEITFKAMIKGEVADDAVMIAMHDVYQKHHFSCMPYEAMFAGQRADLAFKQPPTYEALLKYCFNVAGSVGYMLLDVLETNTNQTMLDAAKTLGEAMQLTNILRDIKEDAARGRIYLPIDLMIAYQVTADDILQNHLSEALKNLIIFLTNEARQRYETVLSQRTCFSTVSRFPIMLALNYYYEILAVIEKKGYNPFIGRAYVSAFEKLRIYKLTKAMM